MKLRFAAIDYHTKIAAPFVTTEVFVKGCNVEPKCKGCWNQSLWSFDGPAREFEPEEVAQILIDSIPYRRLTICGGEPFAQAEGLAIMSGILRRHRFFQMVYSGWTWEELLEGRANGIDPSHAMDLLKNVNVLVDGRYDASLRNPEIGKDFEWVGSSNQRIIDVQESLWRGLPVEMSVDEVVDLADRITGFAA